MAPLTLSTTFTKFFKSERNGGILLIICTIASLLITNSRIGLYYLDFWQYSIAGMSIEHWINDGLMAIFFLLIGLELEREIYIGELSNLKSALLPIFGAIGGMVSPALIYFLFNLEASTQAGFGVPMATDIAFALAVLVMLGNKIPDSLKVFVAAFAVIDDLGAVIIIALFYTNQIFFMYLLAALAAWGVLLGLNRLRIMTLTPYLVGGLIIWFLMLKSGVHATVAGVILAFVIPFSGLKEDAASPSLKLELFLHKPVAFIILPLFALSNTAIMINIDFLSNLANDENSIGIIVALIFGKPLGIVSFCLIAVFFKICTLPVDLRLNHIIGAGFLGGIGFTMSIFIANLAFASDSGMLNSTKMAVLSASLIAGIIGFLWLYYFGERQFIKKI